MDADLAALDLLDQCTPPGTAQARLLAAGWTPCGAGDWAVALRSPSGRWAARISPFDPATAYNAALYRRAAHTGRVPAVVAEASLDGGATLLVLELLARVGRDEANAFHRALAAREPAYAELARVLAEVHAEARAALPWCGPLDDNPDNVMRHPDGRLVLIDPFYADGPALFDAVRRDPARVAATIAAEHRRYLFDLPLQSSGPADPADLAALRAGLAAADLDRARRRRQPPT